MKIVKRVFILSLIFTMFLLPKASAMEEVLESQKDALNISTFIKESDEYSKQAFPDLNMSEMFNQAIKGKVDTSLLYKTIAGILGKEVLQAISTIRFNFGYCSNT